MAHRVAHEAKGRIGCFVGENIGRIVYDNALRNGPFRIDHVIAKAQIGDELQVWKLRHEVPVNHCRGAIGEDAS